MLFRSDRKSTRLNSSHTLISYAVFCLKKKKQSHRRRPVGQDGGDGQRLARVHALRPLARGRVPPVALPTVSAPSSSSFYFFFLMIGHPPKSPLFPSTPLSQ